MSDQVPEPVDLWDALEEAEQTVARWPSWQQRYDADLHYDEDAPPEPALKAMFIQPAVVFMRVAVGAVH